MHLDKLIAFILLLNYCAIGHSKEPAKDDLNIISKLRQELLENRVYDKMARPVKDSNKTLIIEIKYFGIYSLDLDISSGALSTNLGILISWTDEYLIWNKSDYQGLDQIIMKASDVWKPTLLAWNSIFSTGQFNDIRIGNNHPFVRVLNNGTVWFDPKPFVKTKCFIDLSLYPKDEQYCSIMIGSFTEHAPELNMTVDEEFFCKMPSTVYDCTIHDTKVISRDGYPPFFKFFIGLKRKTAFYFYLIELPYYSAVLCTLLTFFIPLNTNITNFKLKLTTLSFALFIMFFDFSLVFNEIGFHSIRTPYIVKCVTFNFLFDAIFLILICILNQNIQNAIKSPPAYLYPLQQLPFLSSNTASNQASFDFSKDKSQQYSNEWIKLALVLDKILMPIFIILLVIYHS